MLYDVNNLGPFCVVDSSVVSCSQVSVSVCCFVYSLCVPLSVVRVTFRVSHPRRLVTLHSHHLLNLKLKMSSHHPVHICIILNRLDHFASYWMLLTSRCHSFKVFKEGACLCCPSDTVLIILHYNFFESLAAKFEQMLHSSYTLPLVIFYIAFLIFKLETCVLKCMIKRMNPVSL
jgi:hypothetical protein